MKKYIILLQYLLLAIAVYAGNPEVIERQTGRFYIQPSLGLGVNNYSGHIIEGFVLGHFTSEATVIDGEPIYLMINPQRKQADYDLQSRLGFTGGVDVGYQLTRRLSLSAGLWYQHLSCSLAQQTILEPNVNSTLYLTGLDVRGRFSVDYLSLPLLVHYQLWRGLSLTLGPEIAYNLHTKLSSIGGRKGFEDESNIFMEFESDLQDMRNDIELRAVVGCSYEYQRFVLSLRYHHGLNKTADGEFNYFNRLTQQREFSHSADISCRSLQLTLGYRLDL